MPRSCPVSQKDAVTALTKFIDHFKDAQLPGWSSDVWDQLADECGGALNRLNWYVSVKENRRDILSKAREINGINIPFGQQKPSPLDDSFSDDNDISYHIPDSEPDDGESWFELKLTQCQWSSIKPPESLVNSSNNNSLRPFIWTNVIADEFYKQHLLPCAYSFLRSEISNSGRKHYLTIEGHCRGKKCDNQFHGYLDEEPSPDDQEIVIRIRTRNTLRDNHEDVKRFLNGEKRKEFGKQSYAEGSSNLLKRLKRENMRRGHTEGPVLPHPDVIRHARREHINRELGMDVKSNKDCIQRIHGMQFERAYNGSIHAIGYNPLYIFYGLPRQSTLYNRYCDVTEDWSSISIDGTGSLTDKLVRPLGLKSAHIFLHCIVIHFDKAITSVYQMLAESQETETFTFWLRRWLSLVDKKPKHCTTDYCRALLCACSKAFNDMTIKEYVELIFSSIYPVSQDVQSLGKISTFIRIDVAHLIHLVCRWECTKSIKRLCIRDFFVRCIALMVDCQYFDEFQEIFMLTCAVGFHTHEDTVLTLHRQMTVKEAREMLENCMASRKTNIEEHLSTFKDERADELTTVDEDESDDDNLTIRKKIDDLAKRAKAVAHEGKNLNAYRVPKFVEELVKLAREFVLWTSVGIPYIVGHASSSHSEKNFQDLKDKVLEKCSRRIGMEHFMRKYLNDVSSSTHTVESKLIQFIANERTLPGVLRKKLDITQKTKKPTTGILNACDYSGSLLEDSDLFSQENWGGKAGSIIFNQDFTEYECEQARAEYSTSGNKSQEEEESNISETLAEDQYEEFSSVYDTDEEDSENPEDVGSAKIHRCKKCFKFINAKRFFIHKCNDGDNM